MKRKFTPREGIHITQMLQRIGPKWVEIADTMNGCTGLMIKNYCNNNKRKELRIGGAIRSQTPPSINAAPVIPNHSDRRYGNFKKIFVTSYRTLMINEKLSSYMHTLISIIIASVQPINDKNEKMMICFVLNEL
ncbi:8458_t:CDS:2 [Acaulospora morrowiae]|uniref:8458_t:CDS:1 n=1 Tax=Acaulospora morrowiae TaxID=94023 RepID=A0A9N8WDB0_9GLOM|nr:8458_t:CDS:2 [Acaulospora morrowiae]